MPGLVFKKFSASAILVRMAQENPAGVAAGQGVGAASAEGELADPGDGWWAGRAEAGEVGRDLGIRLHPDSTPTPSRLAATAAATTRMVRGGMFGAGMFEAGIIRPRILVGR